MWKCKQNVTLENCEKNTEVGGVDQGVTEVNEDVEVSSHNN